MHSAWSFIFGSIQRTVYDSERAEEYEKKIEAKRLKIFGSCECENMFTSKSFTAESVKCFCENLISRTNISSTSARDEYSHKNTQSASCMHNTH